MILQGKVALVTGGRGGIGRAICDRFLREGATVYAADLTETGSLCAPDSTSHFVPLDITNEADVQAVMDRLETDEHHLDILVNAAGIEIEKTIEHTTLEEWNHSFAVNVTGTFLISKYALPLLRKSTGASIINFGSYDGFIADPGLAAYCATKGAVHALTKAMACDHGPEGIRVNAISPGPMKTLAGAAIGGARKTYKHTDQNAPLRSNATLEAVGGTAVYLASDAGACTTGEIIRVDGGFHVLGMPQAEHL